MKLTKKQVADFFKSERVQVILLIIIATAVRLFQLSKETLWLDEAYTIKVVFWKSLPSIIANVHHEAINHPPLFFIIYNVWGKIFGISEFALISLSIISGILFVFLMYLIVKELFNYRGVAFMSALLASFSLFHFHFSREAVQYSFFPMMILLSIYTFLLFLKSKPEKRITTWAIYIITTAALFYTHYYAFMIILVQNLVFFIFWKKNSKLIKYWIVMQLILLLLISPELSYMYTNAVRHSHGLSKTTVFIEYAGSFGYQIKDVFIKNTGELGLVLNAFFKQSVASIVGIILSGIIALLILGGIVLSWMRSKKENVFNIVFLLLLVFVPILITSISPEVYRAKGFVFTALIYSVFLVLGIRHLFKSKVVRIIVVGIILLIGIINIAHSIGNNYFFGEQEDWEGAVDFLKQPEQKAELILVEVRYTLAPFFYYYNNSILEDFFNGNFPLNSSKSDVITVNFSSETDYSKEYYRGNRLIPDLKTLNESLERTNDFWLVSSIHTKFAYPNNDIVNFIEKDFEKISKTEFGSVDVIRYKRK